MRSSIDEERWQKALLTELDHYASETAGRAIKSIFFGGGTPSLMPPRLAGALIEAAARHWRLDAAVEITLEANPGTVDAARFADFRAAGINRLSLGVQALDDEALRFLGRIHDAPAARRAIEAAGRLFPRYSFDLIYARPGQSEADWRTELKAALDLAGDHLSVYQLTLEEGTPFHAAWQRGELHPVDEDRAAGLYELTQAILAEAGLPAYEISNHARPGGESRHNLIYWQGGDYIGVGPGAHGRLTLAGRRHATHQIRLPEKWLERTEAEGHASRARVALGRAEQIDELMMMGLRLTAGVGRARFNAVAGAPFEEVFAVETLALLQTGELLEINAEGLRLTAAGRQRLDAVLARLLASSAAS